MTKLHLLHMPWHFQLAFTVLIKLFYYFLIIKNSDVFVPLWNSLCLGMWPFDKLYGCLGSSGSKRSVTCNADLKNATTLPGRVEGSADGKIKGVGVGATATVSATKAWETGTAGKATNGSSTMQAGVKVYIYNAISKVTYTVIVDGEVMSGTYTQKDQFVQQLN